MRGEVNEAFTEALEEIGNHTTPEQLRRRGIRSVLSVGRSDVSRLIEIAVNRTLMERTIGGLDDDEKRFVIDQAHEVFEEGLQNLQDLRESRRDAESYRREMQEGLAKLREELAPRRGFVEQFEEETESEKEAKLKSLRLRIQARLLPVFDRLPPGGPTLRGTALELLALFAQERDKALEEQKRELTGEIDQLERRITKLLQSLEETEKVLERISAAKDLEIGIESIYRNVQGLNPGEADQERKKELMKVLFKANLALQEDLLAG
jgi:DNA repair exonuclease SbcCD ATPase subunit